MDKILEVKDIFKSYNGNKVLNGISMSINKGDIYGFVGKNGAGKTTLIRIISGLINQDKVEVSLFGVSNKSRSFNIQKRKLCTMVESPSIYVELSAIDNMKMQCLITNKDFSIIDELLNYVGLGNTGNKKAKDFSLGMRQRLGIAMSLVNNPELMLLDEPINGLDPEGIKQIRELLLKMNSEKGITILISSHILSELSLFATRFGFIDNGKILKETTIQEIKKESANRCFLLTTDNKKAIAILEQLGYVVTEKEQMLLVNSDVDLMEVCESFKKSKLRLLKHEVNAPDLENYFMRLIGEK
ncbi:MAG: ATP-binding cassette domain-containing protein [Bacilli bacterium]